MGSCAMGLQSRHLELSIARQRGGMPDYNGNEDHEPSPHEVFRVGLIILQRGWLAASCCCSSACLLAKCLSQP